MSQSRDWTIRTRLEKEELMAQLRSLLDSSTGAIIITINAQQDLDVTRFGFMPDAETALAAAVLLKIAAQTDP